MGSIITWNNVDKEAWYHDPVTDAAKKIKWLKNLHDHPSKGKVAGFMVSGGILAILGVLGIALIIASGSGAAMQGIEFPGVFAVCGGALIYLGWKRLQDAKIVEEDLNEENQLLYQLMQAHNVELAERLNIPS